MPQPIIQIENLGKSYLVGHNRSERYTALRDVIGREAKAWARKAADLVRGRQIIEGDEIEEFWALRDVSFDVQPGEVVGIIGRNGAGKSTLLKILSRISEPTRGRVTLRGRIASLLEVGTGFHPELTGRENIFLNGAILGMTRAEIARKFDEIVAFAEIDKFLDTPVKRYSSGMYMRLAFAVAAHLEPEILAVDEVLAVGDADFQKKSLGKMGDVARGGRTVLFVSHNMNAIERLCSRVVVLRKGRVIGCYSDIRRGIAAYLGGEGGDELQTWQSPGPQYDNPYFTPRQFGVQSLAPGTHAGDSFSNRHPIKFSVSGIIQIPDPAFNLGFCLYDENGQLLLWSYFTDREQKDWPKTSAGANTFSVLIPQRLLNEGNYRIELISSLRHRMWLLEPGVNAPSVQFTIRGGLSDSPYWDLKRPGAFAPVLSWNAEHDA